MAEEGTGHNKDRGNNRDNQDSPQPGINETGDIGGDSISRDEFVWLNAKTLYDQTLKQLTDQTERGQRYLETIQTQANQFFGASQAQLIQHQADLNAQALQHQAVLNANTQQAQRNAIERENLALTNATHAIAVAQQASQDHRDLSFDSALPNPNIGTATEARGSGRILAGRPNDVVEAEKTVTASE